MIHCRESYSIGGRNIIYLKTTTDQQTYMYKSYFSLFGCPVSCISDYTYPAFKK